MVCKLIPHFFGNNLPKLNYYVILFNVFDFFLFESWVLGNQNQMYLIFLLQKPLQICHVCDYSSNCCHSAFYYLIFFAKRTIKVFKLLHLESLIHQQCSICLIFNSTIRFVLIRNLISFYTTRRNLLGFVAAFKFRSSS
jgi:hypothetical protein